MGKALHLESVIKGHLCSSNSLFILPFDALVCVVQVVRRFDMRTTRGHNETVMWANGASLTVWIVMLFAGQHFCVHV